MTSVFISYSRKDVDFVRRLNESLDAQERQAWVDWEGIPPTAEWMGEIVGAIDAASAFVFVMTPDSLASAVCIAELEHAVRQNKRLVPVVRREVEAASIPPALAKVNWIFCRDGDDFAGATQTLVTAIDTDLDWVRAHTRLLVRAREWDGRGRESSLALRGNELKAAEDWLALGPVREPQPTELQTRYVLESRRVATSRRYALLGSAALGLVAVAILGTTTYFGRREAARQRTIAIAGRLTADAELVREQGVDRPVDTGWLERSVLLATEAASRLRSLGTRSLQTDIALRRGLALLPRRLGTFERRHLSVVDEIVLTSDGRLVVASHSPLGSEGWRVDGGGAGATPQKDGTRQIALGADGRFVAALASNGDLEIWDAKDLARVTRVTGVEGIRGIALSSGARHLVASSSRLASGTPEVPLPTRVWALTGAAVRELPSLPPTTQVTFSPDGRWLAAIVDEKPRMWKVADGFHPRTGQELPTLPAKSWSVQFNADGTRIAVFLETAQVKILTVGDWRDAGEFGPGTGLKAVSADGRYAALSGGRYDARIVDTASGKQIVRLHASDQIEAMAFSPHGPQVAVAGLGKSVDLWQVDGGGSDIVRAAAGPHVRGAGFDGTETSLLTIPRAAGPLSVQRWPLDRRRAAATTLGPGELAVLGADGRHLAIASGQQVSILNAADGSAIHRFAFPGDATALALSPEGSAVAVATADGSILLWTPGSDAAVRFHVEGAIAEDYLAVGPSGNTLAAITREPATRAGDVLVTHFWRPPNPTAVTTTRVETNRSGLVVHPCNLSADARYFATDDGVGVAVVETETGRRVARMNHPGGGNVCAFSADSRLLATTAAGVVRVWDLPTQTETARIETDAAARDEEGLELARLRFSPRNRYLATVSAAGDGRVWLLEPADLIDLACARVTRNLTPEEKRDYFGEQPDHPTCAKP